MGESHHLVGVKRVNHTATPNFSPHPSNSRQQQQRHGVGAGRGLINPGPARKHERRWPANLKSDSARTKVYKDPRRCLQ